MLTGNRMKESHRDRPVFDPGLPEDPIEVIDYLAYLRKNLRKCFDHVSDFKLSFVQQYSVGAANIHLHLASRCSEGGACLQVGVIMRETREAEMDELAMLVSVGKSVEQAKASQTKSLVWLEPLDGCDVFRRDVFETTPFRLFPSNMAERFVNRHGGLAPDVLLAEVMPVIGAYDDRGVVVKSAALDCR